MTRKLRHAPTFLRPRGTHHLARAHRAAAHHQAVLVTARWECAGLRRLTLRCDAVDGGWHCGDRILVRVGPAHRRLYTISRLDRSRREFDVLAVAHPHGPGGRWVKEVLDGEVITIFGPKPDLDVRTDGAQTLVLLGDETTVGLFEAVRAQLRTTRTRVCGAIEHDPSVELPGCSLPALHGLQPLLRDRQRPGSGLHTWVREHFDHGAHTVYFVNGHGAAVRSLRLTLLSMGVRGAAIRSRAYWGRG